MRVTFGEAAELQWRDVLLDTKTISVRRSVTFVDNKFVVGTPKGGKGRTVSISHFVADLLTPGAADDLVFPDTASGHMRGTNVRRRLWSDAVTAARLFPRIEKNAADEKVTVYEFKIHELRHTASSLRSRPGPTSRACRTCWATRARPSRWTTTAISLSPMARLLVSQSLCCYLVIAGKVWARTPLNAKAGQTVCG